MRNATWAVLALLVTCGCGKAGTDTDGSDTGDSAVPFEPRGGTYAMTSADTVGTCGKDNGISGVVAFDSFAVTTNDDGFVMTYDDDAFDQHVKLDCARDDRAFTCTGNAVVEAHQSPPETSVYLTFSASGEWTSETTIDIDIAGDLTCEGDAETCASFADSWELQMPCQMTRSHSGSLEE